MLGGTTPEIILQHKRKHIPIVVLVYSTSCGHCVRYQPEWNHHYDNIFPEYSTVHDLKTPSIASISYDDLMSSEHTIPELSRETIPHVPSMFSITDDSTEQIDVHNFKNIVDTLERLHKESESVIDNKEPLHMKMVIDGEKKRKEKKEKKKKKRYRKSKRKKKTKKRNKKRKTKKINKPKIDLDVDDSNRL